MLQISHQLDMLLLDPNFYAGQQGGATIMRYLNMLNPARRRRVFVVVTSHCYRSMDMQVAFIHGVNLVINSSELDSSATALSKSIQEFNSLYRAFNQVNGVKSLLKIKRQKANRTRQKVGTLFFSYLNRCF